MIETTAAETHSDFITEAIRQRDCPMRDMLDRVGDKWSVLVILCLSQGTQRFNSLRRRIDGISQRMLTETLRQLERDGLVHRQLFAEIPPRVEYSLTPMGQTLIDPLKVLAQWAEQHRAAISAAREHYDRQQETKQTSSGPMAA